jgi:heme/copper-type cytochrome/quinol oxidase subunit 2
LALNLSNKTIAVGTAIIIISLITLAALSAEIYGTLQSINPIAAAAAVTVAIIGIIWLKKTTKS